MNGKELKEIADKNIQKVQIQDTEGNTYGFYDKGFNWDAIAAEISKPLTMEELIKILNECTDTDIEVGQCPDKDLAYYCGFFNIKWLLDLINEKKEGL